MVDELLEEELAKEVLEVLTRYTLGDNIFIHYNKDKCMYLDRQGTVITQQGVEIDVSMDENNVLLVTFRGNKRLKKIVESYRDLDKDKIATLKAFYYAIDKVFKKEELPSRLEKLGDRLTLEEYETYEVMIDLFELGFKNNLEFDCNNRGSREVDGEDRKVVRLLNNKDRMGFYIK